MEEYHETPATTTAVFQDSLDDPDSCCSTPYVSAPSSPCRPTTTTTTPPYSYYFSAPASPMHFLLSSSSYPTDNTTPTNPPSSFDFDFSTTLMPSSSPQHPIMTSADELFFNGQILPLKKLDSSPHQPDRGRDKLKPRSGSLRRRTRSMSPMRSTWNHHNDIDDDVEYAITTTKPHPHVSASSTPKDTTDKESSVSGSDETTTSRSSSAGRSSKRWVFLKEFLYRSKSEGRSDGHKFWAGLSGSSNKDKKILNPKPLKESATRPDIKKRANVGGGGGKRRASPHEMHYAANRAQAEEMRKRTFLPYRQGLLGCLGFSSKGYGAMNGFARALNPVSSR